MSDPVVIYNSINWSTTYDITIKNGGLNGLFDMPTARDDGMHWIPGNDTPVSDGADLNFRRIVINGVMEKSSELLLHTELVSFTNAMRTIRATGTFQILKFWSSYTTQWNALPNNVLISFFGNTSGATKARITVLFDVITEALDIP